MVTAVVVIAVGAFEPLEPWTRRQAVMVGSSCRSEREIRESRVFFTEKFCTNDIEVTQLCCRLTYSAVTL